MLNNLVNYHDVITFLNLIRYGNLNKISRVLFQNSKMKVKESWKHVQNPPRNWWDLPAVQTRWNYLISGDPKVDYKEYISRTYLADRKSLQALSLACGTGQRELKWAALKKFDHIDAYDLSEERILFARKRADEAGYGDIVHFHVNDVYKLPVKKEYYDIVLAEQALHHFTPLRTIMEQINSFLKPDGLFIINEFIGPTRFQWTDKQLEVTNAILSILPSRYKTRWNSQKVKVKIHRPSRLHMILSDPSEAVESSKILPILYDIFDIVEIKGYGGAILALLLDDISQNFLTVDLETEQLLSLCFEIEDLLMRNGEIKNDYIVAVCKKS